jgi:RHS repeat-associated protein
VTEIAPTRDSVSQVDRPLAVVNGVGTAGVAVWNVSVDHLNRPVLMTNATKVAMWQAVWQPWGGAHSITGTATLDTRFPGQWYQSETGLHYNWHRSYDPTVGRYTQPDPLGFVDGPSVYGYANGRPQSLVDQDGRNAGVLGLCLTPAGWLPCAILATPPLIAGCFYLYKKYVGGGGNPKKEDKDPCEVQVQNDEAMCRSLPNQTSNQKGVRSRCWESSEARYGACRAGKSLPPLITW